MLKEKMYRELRDEIEIYERSISEIAWNLPKDNIKTPILFEFLINEKNEGNQNSTYTEINQIFLECTQGTKDRKSFFDKAEQICKNRKNSIPKDVKALVKKVVSGENSADNFSEKEMELLKDTFLIGILIAQAKAFLYDAGYPVENKKSKSLENNEDTSKPIGNVTKRRQDSILELADLYLMRKGEGAFAKSATPDLQSKEFKKQSLELFNTIQNAKSDKIFIPLYIDRNTGAGIYIVGVNRLGETALVESSREWNRMGRRDWNRFKCHFTYIYWDEIIMGEDAGDTIRLYSRACGDDWDMVINLFNSNNELSYEAFADLNKGCISGLDKEYMQYFDDDEITDERIQKYEEDRARYLERRQYW